MKARAILVSLAIALTFSTISYAQQWDWVHRFTGEAVRGSSVGTDDDQNVYLAGTFTGTNFIGTNRISTEAGHNTFVARFSSFGEPFSVTTLGRALQKMLVAGDGSVFVCGNLSFGEGANAITNAFLARLDGEQVVWTEPVPTGLSGASSMAFGPDGSIYVLSSTTQAVVHRYTQEGDLLNAFTVPGELMSAYGISVGPFSELYLLSRRRASWYGYTIDFISRVSGTGEVLWTWDNTPGGFYDDRYIRAMTATPDGGVVWVGYNSSRLPSRSAVVTKISMVGTQEWRTGISAYHKQLHSAEAVTVDDHGNVHVTGFSHYNYGHAEHLLVMSVSPNGATLSAEHIGSYIGGHRNVGAAIAVDKLGAILVTGTTEGALILGSNRLSSAALNGFIARRSTILPELSQAQIGNQTLLGWPVTALPFALQQSSDGGNTWTFVSTPPERIGWVNQTLVPSNVDHIYRLFRTNEVPVLHPPRILSFPVGPGSAFLTRPRILVTNSASAWTSHLKVYFDDANLDPLSVVWTNLNTGQPLTNEFRITRHSGRNDWNTHYEPYYEASIVIDSSMFSPGLNGISVSVSDGTFTTTGYYPEFEVITYEQAVEEFLAALEELRSTAAGRKAIQLLDAYRRAQDREREKLAENRWSQFKRQLSRVKSVSEEQRGALAAAAEVVKTVL